MNQNYFIKKEYKINKNIKIKNENYWNSKSIIQSKYNQYYVYKYCKNFLIEKKLKSVIDIGCGPATKLMKFIYPVCNDVYGIDQQQIIDYCRKKYKREHFYNDDFENSNLNFDKKFDLIICADVIEHILNPDHLLSYIKKFCHKDTYIVLSTPERDIVRGKNCNQSPNKAHTREWNSLEFINYLKYNYFKIIIHKNVPAYKPNLNIKLLSLYQIKKNIKELFSLFIEKKRANQLVMCQLNR